MRIPLHATALAVVIVASVTTPAQAHLVTRPYGHTLKAIAASQLENFKHARYVCHHGANHEKVWSCKAVVWLRKELRETEKALHPTPTQPAWLVNAFSCIHKYEGTWDSNTGNGYYGGLQMDSTFQSTYGGEYVKRWGTADNWPIWAQFDAAIKAYKRGRGFYPWPNTARICGLL